MAGTLEWNDWLDTDSYSDNTIEEEDPDDNVEYFSLLPEAAIEEDGDGEGGSDLVMQC